MRCALLLLAVRARVDENADVQIEHIRKQIENIFEAAQQYGRYRCQAGEGGREFTADIELCFHLLHCRGCVHLGSGN